MFIYLQEVYPKMFQKYFSGSNTLYNVRHHRIYSKNTCNFNVILLHFLYSC